MSEHSPAAHNYTPPPYQEVVTEEAEFDRAHTRYVEVIVPPGGEHTIDTAGFTESGNTTVAYLRTSADSRTDVDALHIEDIKNTASLSLLDESKRVYGRGVPKDTDFLLVNGPQAAYTQEHPQSATPGFAAIPGGSEPYEYGRETGAEHDFADMGSGTSRRHFSVEQPEYHQLIIRDLGSTHGLAVLKRIRTTADGTPIRQPEGHELSRSDLELMDRKLEGVAASAAPEARKKVARELITQGTYGNISVDYKDVNRVPQSALLAREFLAGVALRDPNVAKALIENHIVGVHGTRSIGLLGIMQLGGMQSAAALRKAGYPVLAGEHGYQYNEGQEDTSFSSLAGVQRALQSYSAYHRVEHSSLAQVAHKLQQEIVDFGNIARGAHDPRRQAVYRAMVRDRQQVLKGIQEHPNGLYAQILQHDFPVLIGVNRETVEQQQERSHVAIIDERLNEFRIDTDEKLSLKGTPVVAVPKHYVPWVNDLMRSFGHDAVTVVPTEPLVDPEENALHMRAVAAVERNKQ